MCCDAPHAMAPDLVAYDEGEGGYHCYFNRQPESPEEVERAVMACNVSCVRAVRYAGKNPKLLKRFRELGSEDSCDVLAAAESGGGHPIRGVNPLTLTEKLERARREPRPGTALPQPPAPHSLWDRGLDG